MASSDLSARLGVHLQLEHPTFKPAVRRIAEACNAHRETCPRVRGNRSADRGILAARVQGVEPARQRRQHLSRWPEGAGPAGTCAAQIHRCAGALRGVPVRTWGPIKSPGQLATGRRPGVRHASRDATMKPREAAIAAIIHPPSGTRDRRCAQRQRARCRGARHRCRTAARDHRTPRASCPVRARRDPPTRL